MQHGSIERGEAAGRFRAGWNPREASRGGSVESASSSRRGAGRRSRGAVASLSRRGGPASRSSRPPAAPDGMPVHWERIKRMYMEMRSKGDQTADERGVREREGEVGSDHVLSAFHRALGDTDTAYYRIESPIRYAQVRRKGPQLMDRRGILYVFADDADALEFGLPRANRLLCESRAPLGDEILRAFRNRELSRGYRMLWMARLKDTSDPFPPRPPPGASGGVDEEVVEFLDIPTGILHLIGTVERRYVFVREGLIAGYVLVRGLVMPTR